MVNSLFIVFHLKRAFFGFFTLSTQSSVLVIYVIILKIEPFLICYSINPVDFKSRRVEIGIITFQQPHFPPQLSDSRNISTQQIPNLVFIEHFNNFFSRWIDSIISILKGHQYKFRRVLLHECRNLFDSFLKRLQFYDAMDHQYLSIFSLDSNI